MDAREILVGARTAGRLSQSDLSRRSGVPQSSISKIESGSRVPTVETLRRLLGPLDGQVTWLPTSRLSAAGAAQLVAERLQRGERRTALQQPVKQLADDLAASDPVTRAAQCVCRAPHTGDRRYDAAIAALVEFRLSEVGIPPPAWCNETDRVTDPEWVFAGHEGLREVSRRTTPEPFLRRGVIYSAEGLVSV